MRIKNRAALASAIEVPIPLPRFNMISIFNMISLYLSSNLITDDLVTEKEKYKDIGDDLDTAFVELILKE